MLFATILLAILAWWPGGDRGVFGPGDANPYRDRIVVIDDVGGNLWYRKNLAAAIREWNGCSGGPVLVLGDLEPFTPRTITIFLDPAGGQEPAYGGWNGTAGIVGVGGGWTRTREVLAHEIGHALGFGHAPTDGTPKSIMYDSAHVTVVDCRGLRSFY